MIYTFVSETTMAKQEPADQEQAAEAPQAEAQAAPGHQAESPDALKAQLEEAQAKAAENWDLYVRAQAEMENLRKRAARDVENAQKYALEKFVTELLGVRDSLELGLQAASGDAVDADKIREGTDLTLKMLAQLMDKFDIREIDPQGEKFDPEFHQAMSMQESQETPPNTVLMVMQKGYTLQGRLLRPAMVVVSKPPAG